MFKRPYWLVLLALPLLLVAGARWFINVPQTPQTKNSPPPATRVGYTGLDPSEQAIIEAVNLVGGSVVKVIVSETALLDSLFGQIASEQTGVGSGVIIDQDGYILTNYHVVEGAEAIDVFLSDGRSFPAVVTGSDVWSDLAILKIQGNNLPVAQLGDSTRLRVGQQVIAIGNPFGFDYSVTTGIVSALGRELLTDPTGQHTLQNMIQTDAAINPGNSGGPLVDLQGRVVGINTAVVRLVQGFEAQGLGFAIPITSAQEIVRQIISHGKPLHLGVSGGTLTPGIARAIRERTKMALPVDEGAFITRILPDTPAQRAGLQPSDIIVQINGEPITSMSDVAKAVRKTGFGGILYLGIWRAGRRIDVRVVL